MTFGEAAAATGQGSHAGLCASALYAGAGGPMLHNKGAPRWRVIGLTLLALASAGGCARAATAGVQKIEWVFIDGAKNPELIPEWSAWEDVFSTIAGGQKLLPSRVLFRVSTEEADLILRESEASVKRTDDCNARILALKPLLAKERVAVQIQRTKDIRLECRVANLDARDRVLAALNPEGRAALREFADLMKAATSFTVAKSEITFLRLPQ
jgi:hypothetical protein